MYEEQKSLKQIINFRREKLNDLRKNGVNPYLQISLLHIAVNQLKLISKNWKAKML